MAGTDGNVLPFPDRFTHLITHVIGIVDRAAKECLAYGGPEALSAFRMVNLNDLVQECGSTPDAVSQILDAMMAITGTRISFHMLGNERFVTPCGSFPSGSFPRCRRRLACRR
jgi:hypothetical protein